MNLGSNLADKFKKRQINQLFLASLSEFEAELKPDFVLLASNANLDHNRLFEIHKQTRLIIIVSDPKRYVELLESGLMVYQYRQKSSFQDELVRDCLFALVVDQKISDTSSLLFLYGRNDWECFSQLQYIDLASLPQGEAIRTLWALGRNGSMDVLERVIQIAVELGSEGREGKPVGTIFVIGDHRKVLLNSRPLVFNPFRGYPAEERNIMTLDLRDSLKEVAKLDGAIILSDDGVLQAGGQYLDFRAKNISLTQGLGSRHTAAAAVSKTTKAIAVTISESTGVVRVFKDGEIVMQLTPKNQAQIQL